MRLKRRCFWTVLSVLFDTAGSENWGRRARLDPSVGGRGLGPPSPFGGVTDIHGVTCPGAATQPVAMDMYHEHDEPRAVPGFTIKR